MHDVQWAQMILARAAWSLLLAAALFAPACSPSRDQGMDNVPPPDAEAPSDVVVWGCERTVPSNVDRLDPGWREEAIVVGDFGFNVGADDFSAWRPNRHADLQFKLPVTIEGPSPTTVWIPRQEWDRVSLILSDVPRRGPGNSYRVEDGYRAIRFEPCTDREWSGWVAGLALADPGELVLLVDAADVPRPMQVTLGPWATHTIDR
jgi:hypothetical protein